MPIFYLEGLFILFPITNEKMRPKNSGYLMCIYKSEQLLHQNYKAEKKQKQKTTKPLFLKF